MSTANDPGERYRNRTRQDPSPGVRFASADLSRKGRGEARRHAPLTVVKLGGSLATAPELGGWLEAVAAGAGRVVLVAGGGPFADAVRAAQPAMGFDDTAADAMALLAMEQYAIALAARRAGFTVAGSRAAIATALRSGRVPIWAPRRMLAGAPDVPRSWDVTSDSLSAWLAGKLGAARLLLVKRVAPPDNPTAAGIAAQGIVDAAFPAFLAASGVPAYYLGPDDRERLGEALMRGSPVGTAIDPGDPAVARP